MKVEVPRRIELDPIGPVLFPYRRGDEGEPDQARTVCGQKRPCRGQRGDLICDVLQRMVKGDEFEAAGNLIDSPLQNGNSRVLEVAGDKGIHAQEIPETERLQVR